MWGGLTSHVKLQHLRVTLNEAGYRRAVCRCQTGFLLRFVARKDKNIYIPFIEIKLDSVR